MPSTPKASDNEIEIFLADNPGWSLNAGKLQQTYIFKNFVMAFGFMTQVALVAERSNHHPEWSNIYKTVTIDLTTHEAGGISHKDFALAKAMDRMSHQLINE
ncbi:4a-hydroxytetrahydrobiopterin dehydratase [sulfur-oxidizing endosymbiont of Gigantopelta aegis]|uniref:4a-hydroxytetrahydrobiopterin dehydratase n=1 Tax=sulfur-oxidizing endosymbiont of Gigantopelta aegis TaxID=2794934 RepID=UPI0018DD2A24|nr:4a-hydroxytetrahydrobiopterin dehydratase [sulfur-oxidizing endosymbiont of Gigantopelta aegis]